MKRRFSQIAIVILIVSTLAVYAPSLDNDFVWDDGLVLVKNDFVKSWNNLSKLFTRDYLTYPPDIYGGLGKRPIGSGELTYRPVVTFTYFLGYALWRLNPFGYHLVNLILHILSVLILYYICIRLLKNERLSLFAALIFALHPVQTEAVCNISFREDVLAFLFFAGAFLLYMRCDDNNGEKIDLSYFASLVSYFLALFSKEMAITLPAILLLYDYYFVFEGKKGEFIRRLKTKYSGYIGIALFYLWVWFFPMAKKVETIAGYAGGNFYLNILTMAKVFLIYLQWLLVPFWIRPTIPDERLIAVSFFSLNVFMSVFILTLCFIAIFKLRRNHNIMSFGIAWFFITLFPVSNIFPIQNIIASRYLYIPAAGFCFALASLLEVFIFRFSFYKSDRINAVLIGLPLGLLILYGILTLAQGYKWQNAITFRKEMVKFYPNSVWARRMMGVVLAEKGRYKEAIEQYEIAKKLNPDDLDNYRHLGRIYLRNNMLNEAMKEFKFIVEKDPYKISDYNNYCSALADTGMLNEALNCFESMIYHNPKAEDGYYGLGIVYLRMNNIEKARELWKKALSLNPDCEKAEINLRRLGRK